MYSTSPIENYNKKWILKFFKISIFLLLFSISSSSQIYKVTNAYTLEYMGDFYDSTNLNTKDMLVAMGESYIDLYKVNKSDTIYNFEYNNFEFDNNSYLSNSFYKELGFNEFETYTAYRTRGKKTHVLTTSALVLLSINEYDSNFKYLILQIEDLVFLHLLIKRL
jgi:hypothetical protein